MKKKEELTKEELAQVCGGERYSKPKGNNETVHANDSCPLSTSCGSCSCFHPSPYLGEGIGYCDKVMRF